jgi:SAM-dependent methyltransferase
LARVYVDALTRHARGRLLDLGCGFVPLYGAYRDRVDEAVCIDWPGTRHQSPHLDHEVDLNQAIPLPDGTFDTVLATDVLEHIAHPERLFAEMARLLRPGGKLILGVPFFYWLHETPHDYFRFSSHRLRLFCKENDLEVIELEAYGGSPEIVMDLVGKHLTMLSSPLAEFHLWISRLLLRVPLVRRFSRTTARVYPLGYSLVAQRAVPPSVSGAQDPRSRDHSGV